MPSIEELDQHCRERLTPYKVPKSYEFVAELPRDQTGKIRRSALVDEAVKRAGEAVKA
jgi:acyl-coenzyme A synthetase/AMP-(fatty) acid ligase